MPILAVFQLYRGRKKTTQKVIHLEISSKLADKI